MKDASVCFWYPYWIFETNRFFSFNNRLINLFYHKFAFVNCRRHLGQHVDKIRKKHVISLF